MNPYRTAPKAPHARRSLAAMVMLLVVMAFGLTNVNANCTPQQIQTAIADIGTIAGALPIACTVLTAVDGSAAGKVCGTVAGDVSGLAGFIQGILNSLPKPAGVGVFPPVVSATAFSVVWSLGAHGTQVHLRPDVANDVQTAAKAKAGVK